MKHFIGLLVVLFAVQLFAQNNAAAEKDLFNHFKKTQRSFYDDGINYDQVSSENNIFISKLIEYLKSEPGLIESHFDLLVKNNFKVSSSPDGNFRIYNWSVNLGGRTNIYYNIIQYRYKDNYGVLADKENDYQGEDVIKIFQAELNEKQYYFPYTRSYFGDPGEQRVNNYRVSSNGIFEGELKFETNWSELSSSISFAYHSTDIFNGNDYRIDFNEYSNTFTVPLVYPQTLEMTNETVQYEFGGNKFVIMPDINRIEGDLFSHFNQMKYWNSSEFSEERDMNLRLENDIIRAKLKYYLNKYPQLITRNFNKLTDAGLNITTSKDGKFRAYSWSNNIISPSFSNDWNVCQYSDGKESVAFTDQTGDVLEIYSAAKNNNKYYFVLYHYNGMGGTRTRYQVLRAYNGFVKRPDVYNFPKEGDYSISDGLYVNYDYDTMNEDEETPIPRTIKLDSENGSFSVRQVDTTTYKVMDKYMNYTFDGYNFKKK